MPILIVYYCLKGLKEDKSLFALAIIMLTLATAAIIGMVGFTGYQVYGAATRFNECLTVYHGDCNAAEKARKNKE